MWQRRCLCQHQLPAAGQVVGLSGGPARLGRATVTVVAAELTGTTTGLGATIFAASKFFRMDIVVVAIIIIGVIGVAMDLVMRFLEAKLIPWRGKG